MRFVDSHQKYSTSWETTQEVTIVGKIYRFPKLLLKIPLEVTKNPQCGQKLLNFVCYYFLHKADPETVKLYPNYTLWIFCKQKISCQYVFKINGIKILQDGFQKTVAVNEFSYHRIIIIMIIIIIIMITINNPSRRECFIAKGLINFIIFSEIQPNMFKAVQELRSNLIRNSLKSFVVSPLIRKFQRCAVRAICIGTLSKENKWF